MPATESSTKEENNSIIQTNPIVESKPQIMLTDPQTSQSQIQTQTQPTESQPSSGNNSVSTVKSSYKYNNKYYYNQLDNSGKALYRAIEENIDNLKNGNHEIIIDYDFSTVLNQENGKEKLNKSYDDAVNAINLDVPNLFYVDLSKLWLSISSSTTIFGTKYKLFINSGNWPTYYNEGFNSRSQVDGVANRVESIKSQICSSASGSDYDKIKKSHDWIIENIAYSSASSNRGNIYGAFIEREAVCEGYARTYKYLLDSLGIENVLIGGTATNSSGVTENHIWNYVQLNGQWYAVDPTWDDPIVHGNGTIGDNIKHKYFLLGSNEFNKTHNAKNTISLSGKIFKIPTLSPENY